MRCGSSEDLPQAERTVDLRRISTDFGGDTRSCAAASITKQPLTCTDPGGQGRDRTGDLPLFRRSCGLRECVSTGQYGLKPASRTRWSTWSTGLAPFWPHGFCAMRPHGRRLWPTDLQSVWQVSERCRHVPCGLLTWGDGSTACQPMPACSSLVTHRHPGQVDMSATNAGRPDPWCAVLSNLHFGVTQVAKVADSQRHGT